MMKYLVRPSKSIVLAPMAVLLLGAGMVLAPPGALAQSTRISQVVEQVDPLLSHSSSQGYMGVLVSDVDSDLASKLKLKEVRGAVITLIDHDAPAGQVGLKVNDVVLEVNGQRVEGADQFGRMLREIPAGHKVSLLLSRDGNTQTVEVQLVDRKVMEQNVWKNLGNQLDTSGSSPALGILSGGGDAATPGFHMPFLGSNILNVGAMVEPLTLQMADYLGVGGGIMVKSVARKSEAAKAGLQPHDVILKVGTDVINTIADWDRALRVNKDKPVQVTILRDRKQQIINLQVDSKHKSEVEYREMFPGLLPDGPASWADGSCPLLAQINPSWADDAAAAAAQLRQQMEQFGENFNPSDFQIDAKQMEEMRKQMEQFRQSFKPEDFKIDPKDMEQFQKDMEQFRQDMKAFDFQIDPKQMEEMRKQMEQFRKSMPELFKNNKQQMEQFRREMQEMQQAISRQV